MISYHNHNETCYKQLPQVRNSSLLLYSTFNFGCQGAYAPIVCFVMFLEDDTKINCPLQLTFVFFQFFFFKSLQHLQYNDLSAFEQKTLKFNGNTNINHDFQTKGTVSKVWIMLQNNCRIFKTNQKLLYRNVYFLNINKNMTTQFCNKFRLSPFQHINKNIKNCT